ncbi:HNH endonuclease, partial [Streptomyces sp. SID10244]|nr:HNH endonuclease [Streptomyces sp. SID10244]
ECELDHLVKFNHADAMAGGWTVPENLAPLCRPDHHRKHLGLWRPTMHTDRTITWHNAGTGQTIVTYPR